MQNTYQVTHCLAPVGKHKSIYDIFFIVILDLLTYEYSRSAYTYVGVINVEIQKF